MPFTTRGYALMFEWSFRGVTPPAQFYAALITAAIEPTHAIKTLSELTEIADGNGYTEGGYELDPNDTDFDSLVEDDTNRRTTISIKTIAWLAAAGDIPASGSPARHVVITTDEAAVGDRQVIWYTTLGAARTALNGQSLTIAGIQGRIQGGSVYKSIHHITITMTGSNKTGTATIPAVDMAKTVIIPKGSSSSNVADTPGTYQMPRLTLTNSTTVTATRTSGDLSGTLTIEADVQEAF